MSSVSFPEFGSPSRNQRPGLIEIVIGMEKGESETVTESKKPNMALILGFGQNQI